jgi:hypothetical protein
MLKLQRAVRECASNACGHDGHFVAIGDRERLGRVVVPRLGVLHPTLDGVGALDGSPLVSNDSLVAETAGEGLEILGFLGLEEGRHRAAERDRHLPS